MTEADLPIQKGKMDIEFIEVDGKKINLTPMNYGHVETYITHKNCTECGVEFEKNYTYQKMCDECDLKREKDTFNSFELVEWKGEFPLYEFDSTDKYFFDEADEFMLHFEWDHIMLQKKTTPKFNCLTAKQCKQLFIEEFYKLK